mmetsp:Transcript_56932/g.130970  ORF Transcript_56932/g.130970 Transcript_56932/m.130970 type:complete len:255 (-) Transcript_56932:429-1193(-)
MCPVCGQAYNGGKGLPGTNGQNGSGFRCCVASCCCFRNRVGCKRLPAIRSANKLQLFVWSVSLDFSTCLGTIVAYWARCHQYSDHYFCRIRMASRRQFFQPGARGNGLGAVDRIADSCFSRQFWSALADQGLLAIGNQPNDVADARKDAGCLGAAPLRKYQHGRWVLQRLGSLVESLSAPGYIRQVHDHVGGRHGRSFVAAGGLRQSSSLGKMREGCDHEVIASLQQEDVFIGFPDSSFALGGRFCSAQDGPGC